MIAVKGHSNRSRRRGLEPFGKRRKEFGEAKGRKAERAGASESNESLTSSHLRFTILDFRRHTSHRVNRQSYIANFRPLSLRVNPVFKIKNLLQKIKTSSSNPIKGLLVKKIPNFFPGAFMENHWQTLQKPPKKNLKNGQKTRDF